MNLNLNTVYNVSRKTTRWDVNRMHRGLLPTINIDSGKIKIYVSNSDIKPTTHTEMLHDENDILEEGKIYKINAMFRWMMLVQDVGTTTKIESEGLIDENNE